MILLNKNKNLLLTILIILFFLVQSCVTTDSSTQQKNGYSDLTKKQKQLIYDSCFEIVIEKQVADSLTYDKKLPWDLIPYNIREDKYYSIGTAFTISETELISAFHVLDLSSESLIFKKMFIRDKNKNIYEISNVSSLSNHKDFIKFQVKEGKFDKWLPINESYELNEPVYTAGNAYGEGIIIRKGDLIGTIPESENGEWVHLKSSSDINSGNSGGPLLNKNCEVIGIVVSRKDNISYSLPMDEVIKSPKNKAMFHSRITFGFALFPEKLEALDFDIEFDLPKNYQKIKSDYNSAYLSYYFKTMDKLFDDNKEEIFPKGKSSLEALYGSNLSTLPQIIFKDKNDMKWNISSLKTKKYSLDDNGKIYFSQISDDVVFVDMTKPDTISLSELNDSPKIMMDLLLKGINIPRKMAGQDIRILSFGEPYKHSTHIDAHDRKWTIDLWSIEYSDETVIAFSMPTPQGKILIFKTIASSQIDFWLYDIKRLIDFVQISYFGKLREWNEFVKLKQGLSDSISNLSFSYEKEKSFHLKTSRVEINLDPKTLLINDETEFLLLFDYYPDKGNTVFDIRKISISEGDSDNFFVLYKFLKPPKDFSEDYVKAWKNISKQKHPYTNTSFFEDGHTNIGLIHPKYTDLKDKQEIDNEFVYTLYFALEGSIDDVLMKKNMDNIKDSITILE